MPQPVNADLTYREEEFDLAELFYRLLDRWKLIVLCGVAGAVLSLLVTLFMITPKYESTAEIYVLSSSDSVVNLSDLQLGSYLASDYALVFNTREVNEQVIRNLNLDYKYEDMLKILKVNNPSGTRVLDITVKTPSAQLSADIANELSTVASDYITSVMQTDRPTVLSVAVPAEKPASPSKAINTVVGGVAGALLVIIIISASVITDNRIKSADELQKITGLPVFAQIPESDAMSQKHNLLKTKDGSKKQDPGTETTETEEKK